MRKSILIAMGMLSVTGCFTGSTPPPIEIGHVSDKTRPDKAGDQAELGMRLALGELNKDDALTQAFAGRKVQVRHTDSRGIIEAFESQAVRLDSVNRCVAILGGLSGPETLGLASAKTPVLTFHGQAISGAGNHVFYLGMTPERQGTVLAQVIAADGKVGRVAIVLDEKRPEAVTAAEAFTKTLVESQKKAGAVPANVVTIRFTQRSTPTKEVDDGPRWAELIQGVKNPVPDVVVFAGSVPDFNAWRRALRKELPNATPRLVFLGADGAHRLFDVGDNSEVLLATAFHADPANERATRFVKSYRDAFQTEADVNAALAYDGLCILIDAMKKTPTQLTPEKLREKLLETKDFEGLMGPLTITTDRQVTRPLVAMRWRNGTLTALKTFAP